MANKHAADNAGFWARMNAQSRMFFVLAICAAVLLGSVVAALAISGGLKGKQAATPESAAGDSAVDEGSMVTESGYNKDQNNIDAAQYSTTILEQSDDAGQTYLDETLFVGDSNTARMYRGGLSGSYCTYDNAIGSVGMTASSLASYACIKFQGYSGYKTMPEAVALMQPRRVLLTFGTNDLSPSRSAETFIEGYRQGIEAIVKAYPSVDVIVNSIPPLGQEHSNASLTQSQVDEYNKAIVQMCKDNGWKYLNSAEALKDSATGYAKAGYVISSDGIHFSDEGMTALFNYVRTHSYITEDDRPALTAVPQHIDDKDVVTYTAPIVSSSKASHASSSEEVVEEAEPTPEPTEAPTATPAPTATAIAYTYWTEVIQPTATTQGYTIYHCNEDPSKDYIDQNSYTPMLPATPEPPASSTEVPASTAVSESTVASENAVSESTAAAEPAASADAAASAG